MICRRVLQPTDNRVIVVWEKLLNDKIYLTKDLIWEENASKGYHIYITVMDKIWKDIRATEGVYRGLILLKRIITL